MTISIHVPRVEDDRRGVEIRNSEHVFQSTSPVWRTTVRCESRGRRHFISIHVPRVEDDTLEVDDLDDAVISIHVPRVEDDVGVYDKLPRRVDFNPRPPCGGRREAET